MKNIQGLLKHLIWPGIALTTAGIVVGLLNNWTLVAVALLVVGLLLLVASIAAGDFGVFKLGFWQRRSTQAGTNAAVSVLSVLVILGIINFIGARYDSRIDLTDGQLLTLSPVSQEVVRNLETPTQVLIFSSNADLRDQQLLENYRRYNSDLSYEYIDPFANPEQAQALGVTAEGEVYVQAEPAQAEPGQAEPDQAQPTEETLEDTDNQALLVQTVDLQERLSERQLTNKLAQLSQNETATAYFLQGHDEYAIDGSRPGLFEAASRLASENFTVAPLNLAESDRIPEDADVVIVAGPQQALFETEVIILQDYLESGGSLLVMVDPRVETGLEALMNQWGVVPEETVVIDTSDGGQLVGLGPAAPLVTDYGDHPITEAFDQGRSFFPVARPLQISEVANIEADPLLFTNQNSHTQALSNDAELSIDPNRPPEGPFALGVALSGPDEARMVVIGNSSFATDGLFDQQLNGDVFLNAVSWLSKIENPTLEIRPKEVTNRRLNMTVQQQILLTVLALIGLPLAGLVGAGTLWLRRR
ncbi:Gldg family protein [cf. Phormidesmis sp. LEGE 11477]|uniref:GldG family protein n=1 Tax=cf. Phormidesmis sp. LEGE 11477 TaxID=1828680 RepID=UPI001882E7E0|nr:Gldg family protein [cf. Phormidesmis sp. LEGE 11477]MBE9063825.1 Gldg family protein [cf. Phormidesmis sp. LEGE 11477]